MFTVRLARCCICSWWRHPMETFSMLLTLCARIRRSPVNSPHKVQWCKALVFSLICAWTTGSVNPRDTGDLRRHRAHYDVTVICGATHIYQLHLGRLQVAALNPCQVTAHSLPSGSSHYLSSGNSHYLPKGSSKLPKGSSNLPPCGTLNIMPSSSSALQPIGNPILPSDRPNLPSCLKTLPNDRPKLRRGNMPSIGPRPQPKDWIQQVPHLPVENKKDEQGNEI